jgi:hypothetical protein
MAQLTDHRRYQFMYLDALFELDPSLGTDYADLHVDLLAEFNRQRLMKFLRSSTFYNLGKVGNWSSPFSPCYQSRRSDHTFFLLRLRGFSPFRLIKFVMTWISCLKWFTFWAGWETTKRRYFWLSIGLVMFIERVNFHMLFPALLSN